MATDIIFREAQRPRHWYFWVFLVFLILLTWAMAIFQLLLGVPVGNNPASDLEMVVIFILAGIAFPIFLLMTELAVEVRAEGLYVRFRPFHLRFVQIRLDDVVDVRIVDFSPFADFGGWGIRYGNNAKAYTINGNRGVRLSYIDGHDLIIGSVRPQELESAIRSIWRAERFRISAP